MKRWFLFLLLTIAWLSVYAQGNDTHISNESVSRWYFGIEAGIRTFDNQSREFDFIREEAVYYYGYYGNYSAISSISYMPVISLKAEYRIKSDKLWLSGGVDYAFLGSSVGKVSKSQIDSDYLYVMLNQDQDDTYYYRVKGLEEKNHYVGIPVDIRYSPFLPRFFRLYFKLGMDFNFKVASSRDISLYDSQMDIYEDELLSLFSDPGSFFSTGSLGIGFQLGKQDKPNVRIEGELPTIVLTPEALTFLVHTAGGGVKLSFVVPFKSN